MRFSFVLPQVSKDKLQPFNVHLWGWIGLAGAHIVGTGSMRDCCVDRFYATAKHTVLDPSVDHAP